MNAVTPFPNQGEIIRYLANAFDLKASKKKLDDYVRQGDTNYRLRDQLIDDVFKQPFSKLLDAATANRIAGMLHQILNEYIQIVNTTSAECITREHVLSILFINFIGPKMIWALKEYLQPFGLSAQSLFKSKQTTIDIVLNWFDKNLSQWREFYQKLDKEQKYRLEVWRKNKELPQHTSIKALPNWLTEFKFDSKTSHIIKALLLVARALDWSRRSRILCSGEQVSFESKFGAHLSERQALWFNTWSPKVDKLFKRLCLLKDKSSVDKEYTREVLDKLIKEFEREIPDERLGYNLYWLEARWYLYSGELKTSLKHYKKAFEFCLYTAGTEQERLFKEACVVAAKAKDRAFMKRLKNQAIVFGWLEPPSKVKQNNVNNQKSRSKDNIVEDWEVERWASEFNSMLPQSSIFPDCKVDRTLARTGPLLYTFEEVDSVTPDFRNLDRVRKFGSWQKKMPQLVFFIMHSKRNYVEQLLEKGASVNVASESGETPILMAIQQMDVTITPIGESDECYFNLIAACKHDPQIINMRTSKRKLLPLISAVQTGRPDVVKKVVELGAEVDRKGQFEDYTALYSCFELIGQITNPAKIEKIKAGLRNHPNNMMLDSLQRTENMGITLEDTKEIAEGFRDDSDYQFTMDVIDNIFSESRKVIKPANVRQIAMILLDAGANPNVEHFFDELRGYTPLMMAAEGDEVEIFARMLECGGDPLKTFYSPNDGNRYNCCHVAYKWKSAKVLLFFQQHFPREFGQTMAQISAWSKNSSTKLQNSYLLM